MHKDQTRVQEAFLPLLASRIVDPTPEAERDCTVLNRMFVQGADPLFIMEAAPELFEYVCLGLGLTVGQGREAVETAHWRGPAALLDGAGLPYDDTGDYALSVDGLSILNRQEALWLVLANVSDCTEEGYTEESTILDRMRRAIKATLGLAEIVARADEGRESLIDAAISAMHQFRDNTEFEWDQDDPKSIPTTDKDHGFYVGYKEGFSCVAVRTPSLTFYGTPPEHSLEDQGITVDKQISPQFGIVFHKDA